MLGEAVLGQCPSAEKIDITRFWNWQDSPADTAPAISPVTLPTGAPSLAAGVTAPNSLTNLPSLINNVLSAPAPDTSLLQALSKNASCRQDFSAALTGAATTRGAHGERAESGQFGSPGALQTAKDTQMQAMATAATSSAACTPAIRPPDPGAGVGDHRQG